MFAQGNELLLEGEPIPRNGFIELSDAPGFGYKLNERVLRGEAQRRAHLVTLLSSMIFDTFSAAENNVNRRDFLATALLCADRGAGFSGREKQTEDHRRAAREDEGPQGCACVHARSRIMVDGRG